MSTFRCALYKFYAILILYQACLNRHINHYQGGLESILFCPDFKATLLTCLTGYKILPAHVSKRDVTMNNRMTLT